jgi:hypothetical protein
MRCITILHRSPEGKRATRNHFWFIEVKWIQPLINASSEFGGVDKVASNKLDDMMSSIRMMRLALAMCAIFVYVTFLNLTFMSVPQQSCW